MPLNQDNDENEDIDFEAIRMNPDLRLDEDENDDDDDVLNNDNDGDDDDKIMKTDDNDNVTTAPPSLPQQQLHHHQQLQLKYPYQCRMEITLPSLALSHPQQRRRNNNTAQELQRILQVDPELTHQTYKVITTCCSSRKTSINDTNVKDTISTNSIDGDDDTLVIQFYATQCKGLRVSISSFLEYIQVALKCYQEFS